MDGSGGSSGGDAPGGQMMWWPVALSAIAGAVLAWPATMVAARHIRSEASPISGSVVAIAGGIIGGGFGYALGWSWLLVPFLGLVGVLIALAMVDLAEFRLPNRILIPGGLTVMVVTAVIVILGATGSLRDAAIGTVIYFVLMAVLFAISRGALGFGDVRLAVLLGWCTGLLGWRVTIAAIILGSLFGGGVAVVALLRGADRKSSIPYGPPMMLGACLAIVLTGSTF
ncbi:MAG: hypothetical protein GEU79_02425 [Acidimicrobiia bacterium]|nr:hypothetical protein [Acidimicrobiia bacterium]